MDGKREQAHWLRMLREAERELDTARLRTEVNSAARRLMNAKQELKWLGVDWRAHLIAEATLGVSPVPNAQSAWGQGLL